MAMMRRFSPEDRRDMVGDNGRIGITCEFCSRVYDLDPAEVEAEIAQARRGLIQRGGSGLSKRGGGPWRPRSHRPKWADRSRKGGPRAAA
jgi:hypothetical protein